LLPPPLGEGWGGGRWWRAKKVGLQVCINHANVPRTAARQEVRIKGSLWSADNRGKVSSNRTLTFAQWDFINARLDAPSGPAQRRGTRAMRWLYATGLRTSEITSACCGDLELIELNTEEGATRAGWLLTVIGKGEKARQVPVSAQLIDELNEELARNGRLDVRHPTNTVVPILALFDSVRLQAWSRSGMYKSLKAFLDECGKELGGVDATQLHKASRHWLRHSHGSHALAGRSGREPVPIQIVQNNLGHASIGTTSGYVRTEVESRVRAMEGFWEPV
jgi:integrase